jgi:hypothetical protein
MREHLLTPSLSDAAPPSASIYSANASIVMAFIGGVPAVILLSALNSYRLKRPMDALIYVAAFAGFFAYIHAVLNGQLPFPLDWLYHQIGRHGVSNLAGMLLCGGFYFLHRKQHRTSNLFQSPPSPWIPGIACIVLGFVISTVMVAIIREAGRA